MLQSMLHDYYRFQFLFRYYPEVGAPTGAPSVGIGVGGSVPPTGATGPPPTGVATGTSVPSDGSAVTVTGAATGAATGTSVGLAVTGAVVGSAMGE
jgi:hypothetical protein